MKVPAIKDFKPNSKNLAYSLSVTIALAIIFLGVIGFHIYSIYRNWDALYLTYDAIFHDMDDIGGFVNGLIELIIVPFNTFITGFMGEGTLIDYPLDSMYMYSLIAELITLVTCLIITGVSGAVYDASYDPNKYDDYIVDSFYMDENIIISDHRYVSAESQANSHANWISTAVFAFLVFIGPISTLAFMCYFVGTNAYNAACDYKNYKHAKLVYNGLLNNKLRLKTEKEILVEKELSKNKKKTDTVIINNKVKENNNSSAQRDFNKTIIINKIFFIITAIIAVIGIVSFFMGSLAKVGEYREVFTELLHGGRYNPAQDKQFFAHFQKFSSGTILSFGVIGCLGALISSVLGFIFTNKHEYYTKMNICLGLSVIFYSLTLFVMIVSPLSYLKGQTVVTFHTYNIVVAILAFILIFLPVIYMIDCNGDHQYISGPFIFTLSLLANILAICYFNSEMVKHSEIVSVEPDLLFINIFIGSLILFDIIGLVRVSINSIGYNKYYIHLNPHDSHADEVNRKYNEVMQLKELKRK